MKRIIIWGLLLGLLATSCQKAATITVKLSPDVDAKTVTLVHSIPINGVCFKSFSDTLNFNGSREASVTISNSAPSQVYFFNAKNFKTFSLLVEKGNNYQIAYSDSTFFKIIDSPNNEAQELLNHFFFPGHPGRIQMKAMSFERYTDEKALRAKLDSLYHKDVNPFRIMLSKKEISSEFYAFIDKDRQCCYSTLMGTAAYSLSNREIWSHSFDTIDWSDASIQSSPWFQWLAENYILYNTVEDHIEEEDGGHTIMIKMAEKYLMLSTLKLGICISQLFRKNMKKSWLLCMNSLKKHIQTQDTLSFYFL